MKKHVPVPITIVTGFLGSGKTTLINYILEDVGGKEKLAIIKNEIGDVAVDSKIIRGKHIVMKELLNGCVCCTLIGDLEESLLELVEMVRPDRIIIEASGAANPAILSVNIDRMPFVRRDLIVTVIDACNFSGYSDKTVVGRLQHKFTDLVVINKIDLVSDDCIEDILDEIFDVRPGIPVVRTTTGRVNPDILFGVRAGINRITFSIDDMEVDLHGDHLHEDAIEAFTYTATVPVNRDCFASVLEVLSEEYYRVKGFVWVGKRKDDVRLVNFVCGRFELEPIEPGVVDTLSNGVTTVAFIGKRIGRYKQPVCDRIDACTKHT